MPPENYYDRRLDHHYWMIFPSYKKGSGKSNHRRKTAKEQVFEIESNRIKRELIAKANKFLN